MARGRIIVSQPPSLCRDGTGLFQVGVLRWTLPPGEHEGQRFPGLPMMTVIVKATFSFAADTPSALPFAEEQFGLSLDLQSAQDGAEEGELQYASDFIPMKPAIEILLHGHAYSDRPEKKHPASVEIESVARSFVVDLAAPSVRAPLVASAIRAADGISSAPPVGPLVQGAAPGDEPVEPTGPEGTLHVPLVHPEGFNFLEYAVGPESQRMKSPPAGWDLTLRGLSARSPKRVIRIPDVAPVVWIDSDRERGAEIEMGCDTLWIDTDRELLVMVWRGFVEIPSIENDGIDRLLVALAKGDKAPDLADVRRELPRSAFEPAVEVDDFDDDEPRELAMDEVAFAHYETWDEAVEPRISLEVYASVAAAAAEGPDARARALETHRLDDRSFGVEERAWLLKMGDLAMSGDTAAAARFGELFLAAQDALAAPGEGDETLESYAALKVDVDDARDTMALLGDRRMTLPQWMRMDRRWQRRAAEDAGLRERIDRATRTYRMARATAGGPSAEGAEPPAELASKGGSR